MKNLKFLTLLTVIFMTINGCKKDEPEQQEEQETLSEYHEIANCEIQFPEGTNTSAIGNITIYTAGDFKVIDLSTTANKSANNTQSGSDFSTEVTIGKFTVTLGSVLDDNGQPIAYSVHIPDENNKVMFNATETAVAIVFMHPFLNNYDIETARTIVNKIKQSSHFLPLVNEVLDRMATGHLNISGQDFDPTSFSNFNSVVIDVVNSTYINATVNQDGIEIVDIIQDNQYVKFKVKNNRKRWLKVVPSLFSNGNTSASSFYSELLDLNYPHDYCGSININLLRQYFTNPDLTSLSHTSREFVVQKNNAEQLYIDIYGLGLDEYGNFSQQLYDNHLDVIIISTFQDFVLPIVGIFTGIDDLSDELRDDINIVGRPLNNPYQKMLGRLTTELLNDNDFRNELIDLINNGKHVLASKKIVKRSLEFIVSDTDHSSKNLYDILKETFGADVIKQNRAHFKTALKSYKSLLKAFSILNAGANINAAINTVIYSDWHNQKRIDLTYDNSPTMQTDPVITNITSSSATASGNIVDNNGSDVLESGICWSTTIVPPPSIADEHTTDGQPSGLYSSNITGLTPSTTYYIRAYARNGNGIGYGEVVSFDTSEPETAPTVITTSISNITSTTATSGGNVTDDGGSTVTSKGICWSITPNPTIANFTTTDGSGTGNFVSSLTGLTENTIYYVRAYATNSEGTTYGNEEQFSTENCNGGVYSGGITLATQTEVDNFGSNCYSEVTGLLKIQGSDITSISALNTLTSVDGLWIENTQLNNLDGLDNIVDFGDFNSGGTIYTLRLWNNLVLSNIDALNNITNTTGRIGINNNTNLNDLNGLNNLVSCSSLWISNNENLISISTINNLTTINDGFSISGNNSLVQVSGFNSLQSVNLICSISNNPSLTTINGFSNLTTVTLVGSLYFEVSGNSILTDISGFSDLTNVTGGSFKIRNNVQLNNLCPFQTLFTGSGFSSSYIVSGNGYNPTQQDIIDGNCSQ